jgi:hypothetical protein
VAGHTPALSVTPTATGRRGELTGPAAAPLGAVEAGAAGSPLCCHQLLDHRQLQVALGDPPLQAGMLSCPLPQPYGVSDRKPPVLMTPALKGLLCNPLLATQRADLYPRGLRIPHYLHDLLCCQPWFGHLAISSSQPTRCLTLYVVRNLESRSGIIRSQAK